MTVESKSSHALILLAWIFVGIPLTWGIYNTVRNSLKLLQKPSPPAHACMTMPGKISRQSLAV